MKKFTYIGLLFLGIVSNVWAANEEPLWLRYSSVSPDGKNIAFVYKDRIWTVPIKGGTALPLTYDSAANSHPVWSHDSKKIAYTSDSYGNSDIFVTTLEDNTVQRLTYHSGDDIPMSFSPDDKNLIFSSNRLGEKMNVRDSIKNTPKATEVFSVSLDSGKITTFLPAMAYQINFDKKTKRYLYEDRVAPFRTFWRKHNRSAATYNVWMYDPARHEHIQLTDEKGDSQNPVFTVDGKSFYYLNDASGSLNIWKKNITSGKKEQITFFKKWPVRFLSMADNGTLVFSYDGRLWQKKNGVAAKKIAIAINDRHISSEDRILDISSQATEIVVSPNNKELGLIVRGEVFVLNLYNKEARRITNTPEMEQYLSFSPDGRSLLYATEDRNGQGWKIKQVSLSNPKDRLFSGVAAFEETLLISEKEDVFQPSYSPDANKIAYVYDRDKIKIYDVASKQSKLVLQEGFIFTYADGMINFAWGKNSQWLVVQTGLDIHTEVYLVDVSGKKEPINLSKSGFNNSDPEISDDGRMILWLSDKQGLRQTDAETALVDVVGVFLTPEDYKHYVDAVNKTTPYSNEEKAPIGDFPDLKNLKSRMVRLTLFSTEIDFYRLSPDNTKLLIITGDSKAYLIDVIERNILTSFEVPPSENIDINSDFSTLYILAGDNLFLYSLTHEEKERIALDIKITKNLREEAKAIFEHDFRYTKEKFYDKNMHGVNWDEVGEHYRQFLPHVDSYKGLAEVLEEMQGELNASHQWARYRANSENDDDTASLGIYFDLEYQGNGMKVEEILAGGPADTRDSYLVPGAVITAIDNKPITSKENIHKQLNHKVGKQVLLTIETADNQTVQERIIPVSLFKENLLAYAHWEAAQEKRVSALSNGQIGYIHLNAMNVHNYRKIYEKLFGEYQHAKGVIIDVRDNSGGNLTEQLLTLLSGKEDINAISRNGFLVMQHPTNRWTKPTVVIANQNSYSDGSIFPTLYQYKKIGKLIGSKVPGTGTYVTNSFQIIPELSYSVPVLGLKLKDEGFLENKEITPDVLINNDINNIVQGEDKQLKKAVEILQKMVEEESQ